MRPAAIAEACALGFAHCAWISAVPESVDAEDIDDDALLLTMVLVHRGKGSILELTRWRWLEDAGVRTLFEDGTVVLTARRPKRWWLLRWGLTTEPRHAYELAYVEASSLAELVDIHEARVREHCARGRRPVEKHDLRTYLATRKRWREIADPRMRMQTSIASTIGLVTAAATALAAGFAAKLLANASPGIVLLAGVSALVAALGAGYGSFLGALWFVAPILARRANAPPPRAAKELLALADAIPSGWLPAPARSKANANANATTITHAVSAAELVRLQRADVVLAMTNAVVLPAMALAATALFGTAGIAAAIGAMFTIDGVLLLVTKKTRGQLARERFLPTLVQAEGASVTACATGACATPFGKSVLGVTWVLSGIASLYAARAAFANGTDHAPLWLVAEWAAIAIVTAFIAASSVKKRHRKLVAA